jgi:hypothetical protein
MTPLARCPQQHWTCSVIARMVERMVSAVLIGILVFVFGAGLVAAVWAAFCVHQGGGWMQVGWIFILPLGALGGVTSVILWAVWRGSMRRRPPS